MYWMDTSTLLRKPASVIVPAGTCEQVGRAVPCTSSSLRCSWFGGRHQAVEDLHRDRHEARVRDPGAVVAVAGLAFLVGAHLGDRRVVRRRIALDRDLRGHAAHRERAAAMRRLDQQLRVRAQEVRRHRHLPAVRQHLVRVAAELLDEAEDVVPAPAVEADDVVAQLPEDLVHLEGGEDHLDQQRRLDRLRREAEARLGVPEHLGPEPCLEMALGLRQVEVRAGAVRASARRGCGTGTGRSRRMRPGPAVRRRGCASRRGASRAAGRSAWRSTGSAGSSCPPGS